MSDSSDESSSGDAKKMTIDCDLWMIEPQEKINGYRIHEMITRAQHQKIEEFDYMENGEKIHVKLDRIWPRTPEMMYWG